MTAMADAQPGEPSARPLAAKNLSGSIGAELTGTNLRDAGANGPAALRQLVAERQVVFVRGFGTGEGAFADLATSFGSLSSHPLHTFLGRDQTVAVIADTAERPPAGFPLHTDISWVNEPPRFGFLQALTIPARGGDTIWVSQAAVLDSLSPTMASFLTRLTAIHQIDATLRRTVVDNHGEEVAGRFETEHPPVQHPLVRQHPDTGEPSLFLCPMYLASIPELAPTESDALLSFLNERLADPNYAVRWTWTEGDLAIWDEATTAHQALVDHYPQHRRMRRCTVGGDRPLPAPTRIRA